MARNYAKYLHSYLLHDWWGALLDPLTDEEIGKVIRAIFCHCRGGSARSILGDDDRLRAICRTLVVDLERSSRRFLERSGKLEEILKQQAAEQKELETEQTALCLEHEANQGGEEEAGHGGEIPSPEEEGQEQVTDDCSSFPQAAIVL